LINIKKTSHLIIGSNSFLGVTLSKVLKKQDAHVVGVYHKNKNNLNSDIQNIPIRSWDDLDDNFNVVHIISAFIPEDKENGAVKQRLFEVNVDLVRRICEKFQNAKIVYCSTVSVYQNTTNIITEGSHVKPISAYGNSKLEGEHIVRQHKNYAIVRISSMYGPQMKLTTFLPLIIRNAITKKRITLFGDGNRLQNYIHVCDVAKYLVAASTYDKNETFLATHSKSLSNTTIAQQIRAILEDISIEFVDVDDSNSYLYNNQFTNTTLNTNCSIDIEKGLTQLITWMKKEY